MITGRKAIEKVAIIKLSGEEIPVYKLKTGRWADATSFKMGQDKPFAYRDFSEDELTFTN